MKIHDISLAISPDLPVWPGDPAVQLERFSRIEDGAEANISRMALGVHTGTHLDAPYHFIRDGITVEQLPLNILTGKVWVADLPETISLITREVLNQSKLPSGVERILFKTRNSRFWERGVREFQTDYTALSEDGAEYLILKGIRLIGIDYLSIAPYHNGGPTHRTLLRSGIVVVEGVDLSGIYEGWYTLSCLPIKLLNCDGAPARVILIEE